MIKLGKFPILDESFLRGVSIPVENTEEAEHLKEKLLQYFPTTGAYAVAAPQIGLQSRAFLAKLPAKRRGDTAKWVFCCNPEILDKYEPITFTGESCLSFPNKPKNTDRFKYIKAKYYDENLEERIAILEDLEAVIFQHEIDHLNGVLYFDHTQCTTVKNTIKVGRNASCPCNSGKKYKKCCLP